MLSKEEIEKVLLWWKVDGTIFVTDVEKIENYILQLENQLKAERQDYMQMIYGLRGKNVELDRKINKQNKIIDEMAKEIEAKTLKKTDWCKLYSTTICKYDDTCLQCIKQYFEKKVEGK